MSDLFQNDPSEVVTPKFEDLVGEGKRYSDQDAVAKAIAEKDRFIEQLKRENAEKLEALNKQKNETEFMDRLEQLAQRRSPEVPPQEAQRDAVAPAVTPEKIEEIIEKREARKSQEQNLNDVARRLAEIYGAEWKAKVQAKARELGVGTQYLTNLGAEAPSLLYAALGVTTEQPRVDVSVAPPRTAVQTPTQMPTGNVKDYSYWQAQRKEKGDSWYFSTSVQQQVWQEVKSQGEDKFYARST